MKRPSLGPRHLVVSCEHASSRIPVRYRRLGLPAERLEEHIAWDRGAAVVTTIVARRLRARSHQARWSRLLIDPNRSIGHPKLIPSVAFGVTIPGNRRLGRDERDHRIRTYYEPYRDAVLRSVLRTIREEGCCLHLGVHSFVPTLNGIVRRADFGLLYDPRRRREAAFADLLRERLREQGFDIRMNFPYRGTSDGFATGLRRRLRASVYLGLELEMNQRLLDTRARTQRLGRILAACLAQCLEFS
jgi:predicted N-formylglutamate amidohydrolase